MQRYKNKVKFIHSSYKGIINTFYFSSEAACSSEQRSNSERWCHEFSKASDALGSGTGRPSMGNGGKDRPFTASKQGCAISYAFSSASKYCP